MEIREHWQTAYRGRTAEQMSWFRPHLEVSLDLIERSAPSHTAAILDAGGGASTLVDDLLARGYQNLTVLDLSQEALSLARQRLGAEAGRVQWMCADVTRAELPADGYEVWHDRAVFHFLTLPEERRAYVEKAALAVRSGGSLVVATFAHEGPEKCSGLPVTRYNAAALGFEFAPHFQLVESAQEPHRTPDGRAQPFLYCLFERRA